MRNKQTADRNIQKQGDFVQEQNEIKEQKEKKEISYQSKTKQAIN